MHDATKRLARAVDLKALSDIELREFIVVLRDELHSRIDGLTPGGDDAQHWEYHKRRIDDRIRAETMRIETGAKVRAGILIGLGMVAVFAVSFVLYQWVRL